MNSDLLLAIWCLIFFFSNKKTKGATAIKPTKNLTALKVKGPILSMPASCAIKVVPQISVQITKQINDIALFINKTIPLTYRQNLFLDFLLNAHKNELLPRHLLLDDHKIETREA